MQLVLQGAEEHGTTGPSGMEKTPNLRLGVLHSDFFMTLYHDRGNLKYREDAMCVQKDQELLLAKFLGNLHSGSVVNAILNHVFSHASDIIILKNAITYNF